MRSSCLPRSTISPSCNTQISIGITNVEDVSNAKCTALHQIFQCFLEPYVQTQYPGRVASSRIKIGGFFRIARAILTR